MAAIWDFRSERIWLFLVYMWPRCFLKTFELVGLLVQEKKPKNRCSLIFDRNDFSYFCTTSHPDASYQVSNQLTFFVQEKKREIDFQDGHHGHLGFLIGTILPIFDLQVTPMLPTKFRVLNFRSERFKLFLIYKSPRCFLPSFESIGLLIQEKPKIYFQDGGHLGFPIGTILAIF